VKTEKKNASLLVSSSNLKQMFCVTLLSLGKEKIK
jgi:hypothetical protein